MSWKTILIAAASAAMLASPVFAQDDHIVLVPLFVDSEHNRGVGSGEPQRPGMSLKIYFEDGLARNFEPYLGDVDTASGRAPGTIYVYRYQAVEMGGAAIGYNHAGNGAFFHPTIVLPASAVPEVAWVASGPFDYSGVIVESVPFVADRGDSPSIALSQELSGNVLDDYSATMSVGYHPGNTLYPGGGTHVFAKGAVSFTMAGFWGPTSSADPDEYYFSSTPAQGPMEVAFGADGYTSTTVTLTAQAGHAYDYQNLLAATTGKSASQYLEEIGYEPSPPPVWVKKMALEEKLTGKTQWLYPPLTRYADVNGDGVYDAADLAAAYSAAKRK